jgi:hypothetical protein
MCTWFSFLGKDNTVAETERVVQSDKPAVTKVLRALAAEDFPEDVAFMRIEIRLTASGVCPYRLYPADGSEYVGGLVTIDG